MSRIESKFAELKQKNKKALITFTTAGDPDIETTKEIVREMEKMGADIIELGIPYSDPIAEGPVIQRANSRALSNHIRMKDVMNAVSEARQWVQVPLVFLLYYNCILQYGTEKFFEDCVTSGVDGIIVPDLPYEERSELEEIAVRYPVDLISMVAPTSKERIEKIAQNAKGFLYCVSSLGVTGVRNDFGTDFDEFFSHINRFAHIPKVIGFGISTPEQVKKLRGYSDGLIVGSAVVKKIEESESGEAAVNNVGDFIKVLRKALDE